MNHDRRKRPHLGSWTKQEAEVPRAASRLQNGAGLTRPPNNTRTQATSKMHLPQASFSAPHTPPHGQTVLALCSLADCPSLALSPQCPVLDPYLIPQVGKVWSPSPRHVVKSSNQICTALDLSSGFSDV